MQVVATQEHWISTDAGRLYAMSWTPAVERGVPIILLHDSLGCVALWRDFPEQLAQATERQVLAYDRLGYGRSSPHPGLLAASFIRDESQGAFNQVRQHFNVADFVVFGHSVGGGMAVECARAFPQHCKGLISESAQAFVEQLTLEGIRSAELQFAPPEQMARLAKYHGDKARWVLRAWIDTWLSEAFREWRLEAQELRHISCPTLCLHGEQDEYGSPANARHIAANVAGPAFLEVIAQCGHTPHRESLGVVLEGVRALLGATAND